MLLAYEQIGAVDGVQFGDILGATNVQLFLSLSGQAVRVYSANRPYFIVTVDGTGDAALLADENTFLPQLTIPLLLANYIYPSQLNAGEHFKLLARITNFGDVPVRSVFTNLFGGSFGDPFPPFKRYPCFHQCQFGIEASFDPGESILVDLGDYYYGDELLQSATFSLQDLRVSVLDEQDRHLNVTLEGDPIEINVIGPEGGPTPNPDKQLQSRLPLEERSFQTSDQLIVHDPNTGYDWIKLHAAEGIEESVLLDLLDSQTDLAGYRMARISEVEELILNYLHARGVIATTADLYHSRDEVNDALYDFIELIGDTNTGDLLSDGRTTFGRVADKPPISDFPYPLISALSINANTPGGNTTILPRSVRTRTSYINPVIDTNQNSYWLVRTGKAELRFEEDQAVWQEDELVLPVVALVPDSTTILDSYEKYALRMNYFSKVGGILQVTEVELQDPSTPGASGGYALDTNEFIVNSFMACDRDNKIRNYHLRMQLLSESNPVLFRITDLHRLAIDLVEPGQDRYVYGECEYW